MRKSKLLSGIRIYHPVISTNAVRRNLLEQRTRFLYLNSDYKLDSTELQTEILLPEIRLDFIGGNGAIYCGHFLNLNASEVLMEEFLKGEDVLRQTPHCALHNISGTPQSSG